MLQTSIYILVSSILILVMTTSVVPVSGSLNMADGNSFPLSQSQCVLVKNSLTKWGYSSMIPIFQEQNIDDDLFLHLTTEQINKLIPEEKFGFGVQWRFLKRHAALKQSVTFIPLSPSDWESRDNVNRQECPVGAAEQGDKSVSTRAAKPIFGEIINDEDLPISEIVTLSLEYSEEKENESSSSLIQPRVNPAEASKGKKRRLVDLTEIGSSLESRQQALQEIRDLDLHSLLVSSLDGMSILSSAKQRDGILDESDRTLLTDIVAKWLLYRLVTPTKIEYAILRDKILEEFPSESNVYYIPPKEEGSQQRLARGKLFDKVRNLKDWMRGKGLLPPLDSKKRQSDSRAPTASTSTVQESSTLTEEVQTALAYIKSHREDWTKIIEKWKLTSAYRMNKLLNAKEGGTILEYVSQYKVLRQKQGYTLLEIDFNQLHPGKEEILFAEWNNLREKLCQVLRDGTIKDRIGKDLVSRLPDCDNDDEKDIVVLQCLASLIPPSRIITIGKKKIKPSIDECRDAFILHAKLPADLLPAINRRRELIASFGTGATIQPYFAFVGENRYTVQAVYVCIDTIAYKVDSVLQGLDVCFKSFFAFNVKYPAEAEELWLFLQQYVYGIKTVYDRSVLKLTAFIGKLTALDKQKPARRRR